MPAFKYNQIKEILSLMQDDVEKFYFKGNKTAGTRVRKGMQEVKALAQEIRNDVQGIKITKKI